MKTARLFALGLAVSAAFALPASAGADKKTDKATTKAKAAVYCPVMPKDEITDTSKATKVSHGGKDYYLCCAGCEGAWKKSPAKFARLSDLRADLRAVESKAAALKAEIAATEQGGAVTDAPRTEAVKTSVATDAVYCAIRGEPLASPAAAKGTALVNGKTYYFCCPGCEKKFNTDTARFSAEADQRAAARSASTK